MIPQSFIQDLLNRIDLVDVIGRSLTLKKSGANYTACCPFHNEKTPSFSVTPTKQFYHCFGCGAHGNAIDFVMQRHGFGFVEAVEDLARQVGLEVPNDMPAGERVRVVEVKKAEAGLTEILQQAARFYSAELRKSAAAIAYLKQRGLTGEVAARFGLGYAPAGWQGLAAAFSDYADPRLVEAGLVIATEEGKRYDRFRDRVMFPILGHKGNLIGFGGRVLGRGEPKYLNSPETPLFEKGQQLYGLYQARRAIRETGLALVVEGYMDVIALAQNGVEYAVATLGTATTGQHVQILLRHTDRIVFAFDGDKAGRKAAWRALENSLAHIRDGASLSFLFLPEGEDPDSFVRSNGKQAFENLVKNGVPLSKFFVQELVKGSDMNTQEGRVLLLQRAKPLLLQIKAPTFSFLLRKSLADLAGVEMTELDALLGLAPAAKPPATRPVSRPAAKAPRRAPSLVRRMMQMLVMAPALVHELPAAGLEGTDTESRALSSLAAWLRETGGRVDAAGIAARFKGTDLEGVMESVFQDIELLPKDMQVEEEFTDALEKLRGLNDKRQIDRLLAQSRSMGLTEDEKKQLLHLLQRS